MRIMTWNINSLRLRLPLLRTILEAHNPDIVCLQETKVHDDLFPFKALKDAGYPHQHYAGMKSYNGVAILSRRPLQKIENARHWCDREDCRHVAVVVQSPTNPITLHNFYVPAGGDVPDAKANPRFAHKLQFLEQVTAWFKTHISKHTVLVGDLNVAPLENDVWSHRQMRQVVSHTEPEIDRLNAWRDTGFVDAMREIVPPQEKLYTWWSYRNRDWAASNRGRRLDHIWISHDLAPSLTGIDVLKSLRGSEGPSDHVPVIVDLNV